MMLDLPYTVLDVFAEAPLEGNALAVVHDARSLTAETMQALARETNLSETTFLFPDDDPERDRREGMRVRIFTTQEELPFAGHPTLGTASWLHLFYEPLRGVREITLRLKGGPIAVRFEPRAEAAEAGQIAEPLPRQEGEQTAVFGTMRQSEPVFGAEHNAREVADVVGLDEHDLLPGYPPQTVSTGNAFCIVALRSVEALSRLAIPQRRASAWLREKGARWFYCIAPTRESDPGAADADGVGWRARMQFYSGEDPATGSAAGPCIAWLVAQDLARSGEPVVLGQGVEMQRRSRLTLCATKVAGVVGGVEVSGRTVRVATGRIFLPIHGTFTQRGSR